MSRLLLVEDDEAVAEALDLALTGLGHEVSRVESGEHVQALLDADRMHAPDVELVLLDVMLPGIDGFETCRRIGSATTTPVILLTARGDPVDVIVGLECGADDYVVKPAVPRVLDARIKAVLRRTERPAEEHDRADRHVFGSITVDEAAMQASRDGVEIGLTPTELRLFIELARHPGHALTRQTLLSRVWDYGYFGDSRLVDACIQRLRAKVEDEPARPALIRTVRGVGYRLVAP